ncbi:MAG: uroporphyrinogen-III synthase [Devosia sp.]
MVRMLVTRPEPDASETAARLSALDIDAVVEPLLIAQTLPTTLPRADGFAALAVTSGNALRALRDRGDLERLHGLPLYAVGDRTAKLAFEFGFTDVTSAKGSVDDLVTLLAKAGIAGPVLYAAAQQQAGDLAKALAPYGVMVITVAVYLMVPVGRFSHDLDQQRLDAALFYSRRTAETFASLAGGLEHKLGLGMLCLSEAIAEPLIAAHFVRVSLADHPSEEAMMALALSFARDQKRGMIS